MPQPNRNPNYMQADPTTYGDADGGAWRGASWILDPAGIGGMGGAGGTDVWSMISGAQKGWQDMQAPQIYGPGGAQAPGAVGVAGPTAGIGGVQNMQTALIQQLQDQAAGRGPSLAQMQLQSATDRNMRQAMALGQSQRGAGAAGAQKSILGQQAQIGQGMANDSAMLRLQEQMAARGALGQQLGQQAGQQQREQEFNATTQQFNIAQQQETARRQQQAAIEQAKLEIEAARLKADQAKQNSPAGMIGGILSAFSDEKLKTDVKPGEGKLYSFLDALGSHDYKYKDSKHGEGRRVSPMAQELEKTELGQEFVFETADGKAVDYGKGFGTILAAQAALHKRLKAAGI